MMINDIAYTFSLLIPKKNIAIYFSVFYTAYFSDV